MKRLLSAICVALVFLAFPFEGGAQTTTGVIDGTVSGPDGDPVPGVAVVASSAAGRQRDQTVYTDTNGYYRLPLLLPDTYTVTFTLDGFQTLQQDNVIVRAGQRTEQVADLILAGVAATETVVAEAPIIDARAAKLAFTYTEEVLRNIPTEQRLVNSLFATVPSVENVANYGNIGQPGAMIVQNVMAAGERANDYLLDGANVSDPATNWNSQMLMPFDVVEEIQVVKSAKPAEVAYQGGFFNTVTKSGGNDFEGELGIYFNDEALQASNASDIREEEGVDVTNELVNALELTASLGGRIVQDELWWYASARYYDGTSRVFGFPADVTNEVTGLSGKLTWQPNPDHRIVGTAIGFDQQVSHFFFGFSPALALDENAASARPVDSKTFGAQWSGVFSDNVFAEAGVSYALAGFDQLQQPGANAPAVVDLATGVRSQNLGDGERVVDNTTPNLRGSVSWFVPDAAGRHDLKFGAEYMPTHVEQTFTDFQDHRLHTLLGRNFAVRFLSTPSPAVWDNDLTSLYAQDAWTIADRVTVNFGVRFAHRNIVAPAQTVSGGTWAGTSIADRFPQLNRTELDGEELVDWTYAEPRFAMTVALDDAGRTVVRGGISRYHHIINAFDLFVSTPAFPFNFVTLWFDNNNDSRFQIGEEGPLLFSFGGQLNPVDENLEPAYTNEFVIGMSHELNDDWQMSANFVYRKDDKLFNTVDIGVPDDTYTPVQVADPGPDGIPGTGDDGTLTVFSQDPDTIGNTALLITNPEGNERTYVGFEFTASKRFSNNWQLVGSLNVSDMEVIKTTGSNEIQGVWDTPNNLINAEGLDPFFPPVQLKVQGTYLFDFGLAFSGFYRLASGNPYTRELTVTGLPQGPFNVFAERRGDSRTDTFGQLDLRFEQNFDVTAGRGSRIGVVVDLFNLFNSAAIIDYGTVTSVDYGRPRAIQSPFGARVGLRYSW